MLNLILEKRTTSESQLVHDEVLDEARTFRRTSEEEEPAEVGGEGEGDGAPRDHQRVFKASEPISKTVLYTRNNYKMV